MSGVSRLPATVCVEERPGRGRCVVAKTPLKVCVSRGVDVCSGFKIVHFATRLRVSLCVRVQAGTVVFESDPYAAVHSGSTWAARCAGCFVEAASAAVQRCGGCRRVVYCSVKCQRADWRAGHRTECSTLKACPMPDGGLQSSLWLMVRVLLRHLAADKADGGDPDWADVMALVGHRDDNTPQQMEMYGRATVYVTAMASDAVEAVGVRTVVGLFCRFFCNNFTVVDEELNSVGVGLYPLGGLLNHSCDPNCLALFRGQRQVIRCVKDVAPGEEVTIGYIELGRPLLCRRLELASSYFFPCACARCAAPPPPDGRLSDMRCEGCNGPLVLGAATTTPLPCGGGDGGGGGGGDAGAGASADAGAGSGAGSGADAGADMATTAAGGAVYSESGTVPCTTAASAPPTPSRLPAVVSAALAVCAYGLVAAKGACHALATSVEPDAVVEWTSLCPGWPVTARCESCPDVTGPSVQVATRIVLAANEFHRATAGNKPGAVRRPP